MTILSKAVTAEELFTMGDIGRSELINGEIIQMPPAGAEHGGFAIEFGRVMANHIKANGLGKAYGAETGFIITRNPDTTRAPDFAFVKEHRVPVTPRRGFFDGPPDLAVEVMSPNDTVSEVRAKVDQWLDAGTVSVWVVDPPSRTVEIYRSGNVVLLYRRADTIVDEPTLPGFALRLSDVFES